MKNKIQKRNERVSYWLGVIALGLIVGFSVQFVRAWVEPSDAPPGGNLGAPINTSSIGQAKRGALGAKSLLLGGQDSYDWGIARFKAGDYGYWDVSSVFNYTNSDLIFSSSNGGEKLRVNANGQLCLGYKDANCTGDSGLLINGNVGVGTATPVAKLDIVGNIKITDGTQGAGKALTSNANGTASWKSSDGRCTIRTQAFVAGGIPPAQDLIDGTNPGNTRCIKSDMYYDSAVIYRECKVWCAPGEMVMGGGFASFWGENVDANSAAHLTAAKAKDGLGERYGWKFKEYANPHGDYTGRAVSDGELPGDGEYVSAICCK